MLVQEILKKKGTDVFCVHPGDETGRVLDEMLARGIGSAVVVDLWGRLAGIVSERDMLHGLGRRGTDALAAPVGELMRSRAPTCRPDDTIADVMALMTHRRVRHVPVMDGERVCGVVSIGDVVKHRLDEIELEVNVLRDYARVSIHPH